MEGPLIVYATPVRITLRQNWSRNLRKISLSEAFARRSQIKAMGQAIYFQGDADDEYYEISFVDKPERRPGWYLVTMKRSDGYTTSFSLPGQVKVMVK